MASEYFIINVYACNVGGFAKNTYSNIDIEELINEIKKNTINRPFIISFQELTDAQIDVIRNKKKVPYDSITSMQYNPSKDSNGKLYYSHNAILLSNDFLFTGNQVATSYRENGRSTKWLEVKHIESGILFDICSLHAKVGSQLDTLEPIMVEFLDGKNKILCGDFNMNSDKLQNYATHHTDHISNYIKKMNNLLWLGKGPDYIFTSGADIEVVNFNNTIGMETSIKIPHTVIRATVQLTKSVVIHGGQSTSKWMQFILY
jgi:hypothetical protein